MIKVRLCWICDHPLEEAALDLHCQLLHDGLPPLPWGWWINPSRTTRIV